MHELGSVVAPRFGYAADVSQQRTKLQPRQARVIKRLRVRVDQGRDAGASCEPDGGAAVTVGTSPDNELVLADPTVSRYHLELTRTAQGVQVVDLSSRNGTFVGGVRIERAVVPPGTRLAIGGTTIAVEDAGDVVAPPDDPGERVPELIGDSPAMLAVSKLVRKLAPVMSSVLIQGETGAGKEVVARALHNAGPRRDEPFVVVDCGSMPATLIESQLFGHEKGSFTGAIEARAGRFREASGGTLFLDEIGDMPLELQAKLLRVLQSGEVTPVGGKQAERVDVRIVAATHRDLDDMAREGRFREDLLYRLRVVPLAIPPLRERPEDIPVLAEHFAARYAAELHTEARYLSDGCIESLATHEWPGNVRELENAIKRALVLAAHEVLSPEDFQFLEGPAPPAAEGGSLEERILAETRSLLDLGETDLHRKLLERLERPLLEAVLRRTGGNQLRAAAVLGINRNTLRKKISELGIAMPQRP